MIIALLLSALLLPAVLFAQNPVVFFDPDSLQVRNDSLFEVVLAIDDNSVDLKAYAVRIHFDTSVVKLDTVFEGPLLPSTDSVTFFAYNLVESQDTVFIDGAILGGSGTVSGGGVIAYLWFRADSLSSGITDLEFTLTDFRDQDDQSMAYSTDDGKIRVCLRRGDVDNSYFIDIDDVTYLLRWIFQNGPAPIPHYLVGDVDCKDETDIDDVVYLIQYIFAGGPPPCTYCYPE